jgi:hypothetical protein
MVDAAARPSSIIDAKLSATDRAQSCAGSEGMEPRIHEQSGSVELHSIPQTGASLVERAYRMAHHRTACFGLEAGIHA